MSSASSRDWTFNYIAWLSKTSNCQVLVQKNVKKIREYQKKFTKIKYGNLRWDPGCRLGYSVVPPGSGSGRYGSRLRLILGLLIGISKYGSILYRSSTSHSLNLMRYYHGSHGLV